MQELHLGHLGLHRGRFGLPAQRPVRVVGLVFEEPPTLLGDCGIVVKGDMNHNQLRSAWVPIRGYSGTILNCQRDPHVHP